MHTLCRYFFIQSFLITYLRLCASKLYLKPNYDIGFDLQNSLESDQNNDFVIVIPNNSEPTDESTDSSNEAIPNYIFADNDKFQEVDSDDDTNELDLKVDDLNLDNNPMLRKTWRSTCDRKAARTCTNACKNAYKIVCSSYKCTKRMKGEFRKECKRNCRAKFVGSVSSESE